MAARKKLIVPFLLPSVLMICLFFIYNRKLLTV